MVTSEHTVLTDRQVEVLELREQGYTQREIADRLGTTDSNVSAVERAARANVEKAQRTLDLVAAIRAPVRFTAPAGESFDDLVDEVYARGDDADVTVAYPRPELYSVLYEELSAHASQNRLETPVEVAVSADGDVTVHVEESAPESETDGETPENSSGDTASQ
ncbi:Tfx family DNA-binding protein [Halobacterium rubrum]|uniref:Tfx family DNA-binding protein n=1 Tax=Halobacterium TaxID=2239 RepID=UPI001F26AEB6|nr:Tfx family DNA-binding protein [Halobacterium rubrum]MDH5019635.1 Tfx family DNA-binding protein [Halobacterium rubrum]